MITLNANKYALPFDQRVKLMRKTSIYEIYRYSKDKQCRFAIIVDKVNVIGIFNTYHEAKTYAEHKYGKLTTKRRIIQ